MLMQTSDLTGAALDRAVAQIVGPDHVWMDAEGNYFERTDDAVDPRWSPTTNWSQAGPIIEQEGITVSKEEGCWSAYFRDNLFEDDGSEHWQTGPTPLIAAMRCFVASRLGDEVDIPEELCQN